MIGKNISHFNILEKLGEGGMGVVYLAEDTRLHRRVALKFLPAHFTSNPDARERFEREARAAAALNHPNIVTVYDIGETDGQVYMAIELVDGETLADRIANAASGIPMQAGEIESIIRQIAEGLGAAHRAGIVHRDIKPSNIMIDREGRVKILDFGLAKLKGTSKLTREASTLGTAQYMSPEQARGEEVDHRSDIWSLGAVLYEMLAGRQPFSGEYDQHVIYSILNEEPEPLRNIRKDLPVGLEHVVGKALRKDIEDRYHDTGGIIEDLESGGRKDVGEGSPRSSSIAKWAFAAIVIIAAAVVIVKLLSGDRGWRYPDPVSRQFTFTGRATEPSISPDGNYVAYSTGAGTPEGAIFIKDIESGSKVRILSTPFAFNIQWSPDGSRLLYGEFRSEDDSGVYLLPRLGGNPRKLLSFPWHFVSWAPDGDRFLFSQTGMRNLFILDVNSGDTISVALDRDIGEIEDIDWSPSGEEILLQGNDHEKISLWVVRPDGSGLSKLFEMDRAGGTFIGNPRWSRDERAIYYLETGIRGQFVSDLMKVRYDRDARRLDGEAHMVLSNLAAVKGPGIGMSYSISDDGRRIVYEEKSDRMDLWLMRAVGEGEGIQWNTRRLTNSTMLKTRPCLSPDGSTVTFAMGNERSFDVYTLAMPGTMDEPVKEPVRLTYLESDSDLPVYSPDGREIAFYSMDGDIMRIWRIDAGGGAPKPWLSSRGSMMDQEISWAPGKKIIYRAGKLNNFQVLDPVTGGESDLIETEFEGYTFNPRWSNSGDKVALFVNRLVDGSQEMRLWVLSVADGKFNPIAGTMFYPVGWASDDRSIFVMNFPADWSDAAEMIIFRMNPADGRIEPHAALPFAPNELKDIVISPDGRTMVLLHKETVSDIWLVEDFDPDIK
jgi:serine/threonine protein kinase